MIEFFSRTSPLDTLIVARCEAENLSKYPFQNIWMIYVQDRALKNAVTQFKNILSQTHEI